MNGLLVLGTFLLLLGIAEATDWAKIASLAQQVRDESKKGSTAVKEVAVADNSVAGKTISDIVDNTHAKAKVHADQLAAGIKDQSLTEPKAKEIYTKFQGDLARGRAEARPELDKLSPAAATKIKEIFKAEYETVQGLIEKILGLLK